MYENDFLDEYLVRVRVSMVVVVVVVCYWCDERSCM